MIRSHRPRATHAVVMSSILLQMTVYRGSNENCQGYIRRNDPPIGCKFCIMPLETKVPEDYADRITDHV